MPATTRFSSSQNESVASRVRRNPRAAAVEARERLSVVMTEEAEAAAARQAAYLASLQPVRSAPAYHRYMLRSMRREQQ